MLLRGLWPGRPPPSLRLFSLHRYTVKKKLSHQMTVKILYLILSCKYFLRIPTKTTFISTESWKSYQLIRGYLVFLFSQLTLCATGRFFCCDLLYLATYLTPIKYEMCIGVSMGVEQIICGKSF